METIHLSTLILGLLAREGRPLRLVDVYRKIGDTRISKTTVFRQLQSLVRKGIVSQNEERYILASGGDLVTKATDFVRMNELKPVVHVGQKGFMLTAYTSLDEEININRETLASDFRKIIGKHLSNINPELKGMFDGKPLTVNVLKKLIGLKLVFVASFDGTDFGTLTSKEADDATTKRKEIIRLLSGIDGITIEDLSRKVKLNVLQVRQVIDPILASGFAEMDESGKIRLTVEVK